MRRKVTIRAFACLILAVLSFNSTIDAEISHAISKPTSESVLAEKEEKLIAPVAPEQVKLPDSLLGSLAKVHDGVRPIAKDDYDPKQYPHTKDHIHCVVKADFDGNGEDDYAILATDSKRVLLVVMHSINKGYKHYDIQLDKELTKLPCDLTLRLQPKGLTWVSVAGDIPVEKKTLKNPAFEVNILETGYRQLHYWEDGTYHSVYRGC